MKILALLDEKSGENSQRMAVANALDGEVMCYTLKHKRNVSKRIFILQRIFPIKSIIFLGFEKNSLDELMSMSRDSFDVIVSSASKCKYIASFLRNYFNAKGVVLSDKSTGFSGRNVSAFILSQRALSRHDDVICVKSAMCDISELTLQHEKKILKSKLSILPHLSLSYISVLIGGSTSAIPFNAEDFIDLCNKLNDIHKNIGGSFVITTSRRTNDYIVDVIKEYLRAPYYLYDFNHSAAEEINLYYGMLSISESIIVTGESRSMCSEACYIGKPVYIMDIENALRRKKLVVIKKRLWIKHDMKIFHEFLYRNGHAKPLEEFDPEWKVGKKLDELSRILPEIKKRLGMD